MDKPIYRLPNKERSLSISGLAIALGIISLVLTSQMTTQYLAHSLDYKKFLGQDIAIFDRFTIYQPFAWITWSRQLKGSNPIINDSLAVAHIIAVIGCITSLIITLFTSYIDKNRLRGKVYDFHGSARWANRDEIKATGLLGRYEEEE